MSSEIIPIEDEANFFDELPNELLKLILDNLVTSVNTSVLPNEALTGLKSLRLVSHKVKYDGYVLSTVFKNVSFYSTIIHVTYLNDLNITQVQKFVKSATFKSYPYPSTIRHLRSPGFPQDYPDASDVAERYFSLHRNVKALSRYEMSNLDPRRFELFIRTAANEEIHLRSYRLIAVWAKVLRRLENLFRINITTELNGPTVHDDRVWNYASPPFESQPLITHKRYEKYILQNCGHDYDQLTKRVFLSLAKARRTGPLELRLGGQVSCNPDWNSVQTDRSVLRRVKSLEMSNWVVENRSANQYAAYVLYFLSSHGDNALTKLDISLPCRKDPMKWPPHPSLKFPHLEEFALRNTETFAPVFVTFLKQWTKLKKLTLSNIDVTDRPAHWHVLFNGIRSHQNALAVSMSDLWRCHDQDWPIELTTQPGLQPRSDYEEDMSWEDTRADLHDYSNPHLKFALVKPQLVMFMRNEIPWTRLLHWEFIRQP